MILSIFNFILFNYYLEINSIKTISSLVELVPNICTPEKSKFNPNKLSYERGK